MLGSLAEPGVPSALLRPHGDATSGKPPALPRLGTPTSPGPAGTQLRAARAPPLPAPPGDVWVPGRQPPPRCAPGPPPTGPAPPGPSPSAGPVPVCTLWARSQRRPRGALPVPSPRTGPHPWGNPVCTRWARSPRRREPPSRGDTSALTAPRPGGPRCPPACPGPACPGSSPTRRQALDPQDRGPPARCLGPRGLREILRARSSLVAGCSHTPLHGSHGRSTAAVPRGTPSQCPSGTGWRTGAGLERVTLGLAPAST